MNLPQLVNVVEVGPRDGFQNIKTQITTENKIREIELLIQSGIRQIEITSFVHPKAIPQMADARDVAETVVKRYGNDIRLMALVPNAKGVENAMSCGIRTVTYVISASEAHNMANVKRTVKESCESLGEMLEKYPELNIRLDVATSFGCPFEKEVPFKQVLKVADYAAEHGVKELIFCDTIGSANPLQIHRFCEMVKGRYNIPVGLHLHDTRGMGMANTLAAMQSGIDIFETSVGGLGGCPFAPGAAGNTATEDLLHMLYAMEVESKVNLDAYMKAVNYVHDHIQEHLTGHLYQALQCAQEQ